jgi:hypothetical protein
VMINFERVKNWTGNIGNKDFSIVFVVLSVGMAGFSHIFLWINSFYYGRPVSQIVSFNAADGWCPSPGSGFGVHCFGDYYSPISAIGIENPWEAGYAYLPISTILFNPFYFLAKVFDDPRVGLSLYLLCGAGALLSVAFWASKKSGLERAHFLLIFGVLATPVIQAFDRGNSIMFMAPLMLGFAVCFYREKWMLMLIFVVIAVVLKPQFLFLFLPFWAHRKWLYLFKGVLAVLALNLLGFLMFTEAPLKVMKQWYSFNSGYNASLIGNQISNANVSIQQGILDLTTIYDRQVLNGRPVVSLFVYNHSSVIIFLALLGLIVALFFYGKKSSKLHVVIVSLVSSSLLVGVSWTYYQVFALVIAALLVRHPIGDENKSCRGVLDEKANDYLDLVIKTVIAMATLNSCFNLPIEASVLPIDYIAPLSSISRVFVAPLWTLVLILIFARLVIPSRLTMFKSARTSYGIVLDDKAALSDRI